MTPEEFVSCVRKEVLNRSMQYYGDSLRHPPSKPPTDPHWEKIFAGYASMNDEQRAALLCMARLAMVDAISSLFGILDGTTLLDKYRKDFTLNYGSQDDKLNGDLQDYFLAEKNM